MGGPSKATGAAPRAAAEKIWTSAAILQELQAWANRPVREKMVYFGVDVPTAHGISAPVLHTMARPIGKYEGTTMKQIRASFFKARCLAIMKNVKATGEPVIVTRQGLPLLKVVPVESAKDDLFGFMAGEFSVIGDIELLVVPLKQWKAG